LRPQLSVCLLLDSKALAQSITELLSEDRYNVDAYQSAESFFEFVEQKKQQIDCLVLQENAELLRLTHRLHRHVTLLPAVILTIEPESKNVGEPTDSGSYTVSLPLTGTGEPGDYEDSSLTSVYHTAEVRLPLSCLTQTATAVEQAIKNFLQLSPACRLTDLSSNIDLVADLTTQNFVLLQQRRLAEKLQERLGYLGVYYRRNPQNFFRHLPHQQQQELLEQLRLDYRTIILNYFSKDEDSNQRIDEFVNIAFFADISVSQIVEIHMDLIDEFSKQLKLEGRSEEVLLDYRLTLIDVIAHLCEMYRRSIPREA
jgi:circadian clock protein KaiA